MREEDVRRTYRFLGHGYETELRVVNATTGMAQSIFVYSEDDFVEKCRKFEGKCNIYAGMNERRTGGTKSRDVECVNAVVIDIDSVRAPGLAATDKELTKSKKVANSVYNHLNTIKRKPYLAMSGNGWQLWMKVKIPLDDSNRLETESVLKDFHREIQRKFTSDAAKIDNMADLARVIKVIGTKSVKNTTTRDRHNRFSKWMNPPDNSEQDDHWAELLREGSSKVVAKEVRVDDTRAMEGEMDRAILARHVATISDKGRDLMNGDWKKYGMSSRSEAEFSLLKCFYIRGIPKEDAYKMMYISKIGKWATETQRYRDLSLAKAYTRGDYY
jgi:hypothetical protein